MTQIQPHCLWIGHAGEARDYALMAENGIEAVVYLAAEEPCASPPRDLVVLRFPLLDSTGNRSAWIDLAVTVLAQLLSLGIPTLVTCGAGISRAPTIASAALAVAFKKEPENCLREVASQHRTDVSPGLWDEVKVILDRKRH
jgi:protein-tyrosine phosphatase